MNHSINKSHRIVLNWIIFTAIFFIVNITFYSVNKSIHTSLFMSTLYIIISPLLPRYYSKESILRK